jgi:hypothetical protein
MVSYSNPLADIDYTYEDLSDYSSLMGTIKGHVCQDGVPSLVVDAATQVSTEM